MELKWCRIDPETATKAEIEKELKYLEDKHNEFMMSEQATKLFLNSIYGACGSPWFAFFNADVAEAVTLQGQDLIKYSEKILNKYFMEFWHNDKKLHNHLGLKEVKKLEKEPCVYIDTDSVYLEFKHIIDGTDWEGTPIDFILKSYNFFLKDYLIKCYDIYAKKNGTQNFQNFELEKISDSGIWLAKKKYVYNTIWKDAGDDKGIYVESLSDITAKGVEIAQSSAPKFVRETLKSLLKYLFTKKKDFNPTEFTGLLKKYKEEYKLKNLEDIAISSSISDYEKYVLTDKEKLVLEKGCPIHVRAAAIHNHKLYNSPYKKRYQPIRSGEKVKYYHVKTKNDDENVFGFIAGSFPIEFAPSIDYDVQFSKSIVQPMNRFIESMSFSPVSSRLVSSAQLF